MNYADVVRIKQESASLYAKLVKLAKQQRGLVPVHTESGDDKRARLAMSAAIHGKRVSGKRSRKDAKKIRRAMSTLMESTV